MATSISHSPAETEELGDSWGRTAPYGQVIALSGEMGAGKTQLVKGLARGLGIAARVHSPTFTLLNIYRGGRLPLFHLDLFRLKTREEITAAGLEEYFQPDGVAVIEWPEFWFGSRKSVAERQSRISGLGTSGEPALPASLRWVQIEVAGEMERRFLYEDFGA
jgi:tRNA threonylcarbamoyladenosine biosynthesis protein TsaE